MPDERALHVPRFDDTRTATIGVPTGSEKAEIARTSAPLTLSEPLVLSLLGIGLTVAAARRRRVPPAGPERQT